MFDQPQPFSFMMPLQQMIQQFQRQQQDQPPARVCVALEFLGNLSVKTMIRAVVNDHPGGIEQIPGQTLTSPEKDAQTAACVMLENYFAGQLAANQWEKQEIADSLPSPQKHAGMLIRCIACSPGPTNPNCVVCKGCGELLIVPVNSNGG